MSKGVFMTEPVHRAESLNNIFASPIFAIQAYGGSPMLSRQKTNHMNS
jgi:hypothetical protein